MTPLRVSFGQNWWNFSSSHIHCPRRILNGNANKCTKGVKLGALQDEGLVFFKYWVFDPRNLKSYKMSTKSKIFKKPNICSSPTSSHPLPNFKWMHQHFTSPIKYISSIMVPSCDVLISDAFRFRFWTSCEKDKGIHRISEFKLHLIGAHFCWNLSFLNCVPFDQPVTSISLKRAKIGSKLNQWKDSPGQIPG